MPMRIFKVIPKLPIQTLWLRICQQGTRMHLMPTARLTDNMELLIELPIQTRWLRLYQQGTRMHLMPTARFTGNSKFHTHKFGRVRPINILVSNCHS